MKPRLAKHPAKRRPKPASDLRARAEAAMPPPGTSKKSKPPSPAEARRLVHDLHVHQIELELQNEELRRAHLELADARDRFSDLYDFAPVGYVTLDQHLAVRQANLTAARMLGLPRADLIGRQFTRFLPPQSQDAFYLHHREVFHNQRPHACEFLVRRADGSTFHARLESTLFEAPNHTPSCHSALSDITPLHQAMADLQKLTAELEQRVTERTQEVRHLGTLVHAAHDAIFTWTPNGFIQFWNAGAQRLYGYAAEEVQGRPVTILLPPHCRAEWSRRQACLLRGQSVAPYETQHLHKDGHPIWVSEAHSVICDAQGTIIALACISRDISLQKEAEARREHYEQQLRSLTHQILQAEERERRRLADDLHDGLAQILAALNLKLNNLVNSPGTGNPALRLKDISDLAVQASQQAHDLTYGLFPPILRQSGLLPALRWLADAMKQRYHLTVAIHAPEQIPALHPDLELVAFRCIQELLANVGKHAKARRARIHLALHNHALSIEVADDGRGFDAVQSPASAPQTLPGGFGLFSIRERLEHLGGSMQIQSAPGRGATVQLHIPLPPEAPAPALRGANPGNQPPCLEDSPFRPGE